MSDPAPDLADRHPQPASGATDRQSQPGSDAGGERPPARQAPAPARRTPAATRRRGTDLETTILRAAWDEVAEHGYAQLTMERVAARARTGKQVLYRRWPNRGLLFMAAMRHHFGPSVPQVPDTGDLREDLVTLLRMLIARWSPLGPEIWRGLLADFPDFGPEFFSIMDGMMTTVLRQAELRGELTLAALPPRVVSLPVDLVRYESIRPRSPRLDAETVIVEIVDGIFLPLVRAVAGPPPPPPAPAGPPTAT